MGRILCRSAACNSSIASFEQQRKYHLKGEDALYKKETRLLEELLRGRDMTARPPADDTADGEEEYRGDAVTGGCYIRADPSNVRIKAKEMHFLVNGRDGSSGVTFSASD